MGIGINSKAEKNLPVQKPDDYNKSRKNLIFQSKKNGNWNQLKTKKVYRYKNPMIENKSRMNWISQSKKLGIGINSKLKKIYRYKNLLTEKKIKRTWFCNQKTGNWNQFKNWKKMKKIYKNLLTEKKGEKNLILQWRKLKIGINSITRFF